MASTMLAAAVILLLTLATSAAASKVKFNVTEMLSEFPEFSTFNNLLSQTKLADEINNRQTITVLVVDNSAASAITSLPAETQKKVLAVQVILDYYDPVKLDATENKTAQLTTLFQASGGATDRAGFLNYREGTDDQMAFGSAEPGAPLSSKLVKVVASRPYNISVMQISAPILPPSIGQSSSGKGAESAPLPANEKANSPSSSPAPSKKPEAPQEASAPTTDDDEASAPTSDDASAPAAEEPSPTAEGPPEVDSATSSAPETEKSPDATADAPTSAGSRMVSGASASFTWLIMILMVRI